ncbi:MAG TPA: 1,4-beta-glucanase, partial [Mycobacterium sp.]|nr:1,4-beta-glucanase [Mycobacterium sp.]
MSSAAGAAMRWILPVLTVAVVACAGLSGPRVVGPVTLLSDDGNPLAGHGFYVDPASKAMIAARNANPPSAELTAVANTPQAYWLDQAFPAGA